MKPNRRTRPARGPYTLPLPPLPPAPRWLDGTAWYRGKRLTAAWLLRWQKIKHYTEEKLTVPDTHDATSGERIEGGTVEAWDERRGRWVPCTSLKTIITYARRA